MMRFLRRRLEGLLTTEQFRYPELRSMFLTLALDQFFIFFIGTLSTAMVSSVGEAAIAAVSMVGTINGMVSLMFTSLAAGGSIVVSRAKGQGDQQEIRRAIGEVTGLCFLVSAALGSLLFLLSDTLVQAIYPDVDPLLWEYASHYIRLMSVSFIPFSVFNAIFNIFRSLGDTRSSFFLTVVINLAHLLLSLLFINGLGLGVTGSGLSYIVARLLGAAVALFWVLRVHNDYGVRLHHFFRFRREVTRDIFSLGMPLTVESLLMQGGMLLIQIYLARLTTTDLAAHAVANSIFNLYSTTSGALNTMASTICGQCFGAGRRDLVRQYCRNLIRVGRWILLATSLILYPMTPLLLRLYHPTPEGARLVMQALAVAAAAFPVFWCDAYLPAMTMRVAGDSAVMGIISVVSLALCRCALGYFLTIPMGIGLMGARLGTVTEWVLLAVLLHLRFRGDRWLPSPSGS